MIPLNNNQKEKELVPTGNHLARLYSIIQVGTIPDDFRESGVRNVIRFTWELPEEMRDFNGEQKPMVIGAKFTASLHEKSNLRPIVEGILGKLSEEDVENFDFKSLVGKPCMVQVVHKVSKTGKEYAAVSSCAQLPKSIKEVPKFNESIYLDYYEGWDEAVYAALPDWIKEDMAKSEEMKKRNGFADKVEDSEDMAGSVPF